MWSALGCLWISSDFIRKKMAEAIPPDNSQLVCVGELLLPKISEKKKVKDSRCASAIHPLHQLPLNNPSARLLLRQLLWDNMVQRG